MRKKYTYSFLLVLLCFCARAQDTNILSMVSPKLRQFLVDHPQASMTLSNVISEAFPTRTVQLYYFYTEDDSIGRAFHYYPAESVVGICIRENQKPCDECICLIFEILNSEGEKRFKQLSEQAKDGAVSKTNFVREIMRQEFQAVKKVQSLISDFKLGRKELSESHYYAIYIQCPQDFEAFLAYKVKVSPKRDQIAEYERMYDSLQPRKSLEPPVVPTNSAARNSGH